MQRQPVGSSSLASVGYEDEVLEVRFRNGGLYRYFEVPEDVYCELMEAGSIGRFFNQRIRGRYEGVRLKRGSAPVPG